LTAGISNTEGPKLDFLAAAAAFFTGAGAAAAGSADGAARFATVTGAAFFTGDPFLGCDAAGLAFGAGLFVADFTGGVAAFFAGAAFVTGGDFFAAGAAFVDTDRVGVAFFAGAGFPAAGAFFDAVDFAGADACFAGVFVAGAFLAVAISGEPPSTQ
jgi:hypothetical protein